MAEYLKVSNPWQKYKEDQRRALECSPEQVSLGPSAYALVVRIAKIDTNPNNLPPIEDITIRDALLLGSPDTTHDD